MQKTLIFIFLLIGSIYLISAGTVQINENPNAVEVLSSSATETILQFRIGSFNADQINIAGSDWHHITLPGEGITQVKGFPQLPVFNRSIIIGNRDKVALELYDVQYTDMQIDVAPSKGVITRDIDPATVPYSFGQIYQQDSFYPSQPAALSEPYILRDFRGITVQTNPFAYNPATKTLRIYTSYKVRVYTTGRDGRNILTNTRTEVSRSFSPVYENHFVNWNSYRYTPVSESFGKLLVICYDSFHDAMLPYLNWKTQKGITTELIDYSTVASTATGLQTYIQNRYNADNSIAYIQLVGDAAQIPTLTVSGGGSDPSFALVAGSDSYPDIFIGRFSAESVTDVTTQINKAIVYERDLTASATWLNSAMGIASDEGGGSIGDMGESDIQHMNLIRTDLLNYGYTTVDQIYDPGASATTVTTNVNSGRGFINYVGHGSDTSWGTTYFSNTDATNLTNGNKTPFIMDVACVNGNFVSLTCFAEAWLRNQNGGAVAMYASSINQSWNPPMRAQDECTDLLVAESKTTIGGLFYNSSCDMIDAYGTDGVSMYKTWHIFGDASLVVRTKTPLAMTVSHPGSIVTGTTSVSVSTGVANTLVAITYNNTIYGRGYTNSSGNAVITLVSPPAGALTYTITATAFNRITYAGTITQTITSGPWLDVASATYTDLNNNLPEYHESGSLDITFRNSGILAASEITAILTCSSPGIVLTDDTETIAALAASTSVSISDAFAFSIADGIAHGTQADFLITMTMTGYDSWTYSFTKLINAPQLVFGNLTIADPSPANNNGRLDPGETANLLVSLNNQGGAASSAGTAGLFSAFPGLTVNSSACSFSALAAGGNTNLSFSVTASPSQLPGIQTGLSLQATAGAYSAEAERTILIGNTPVIGSGTSVTSTTTASPVNIYYESLHGQSVYTAAELIASGLAGPLYITKIGFNVVSAPTMPLPNFLVRMKHTTASNVANWQTASGMTSVYSNPSYQPVAGGYHMLDLTTPFLWNGSSNLVIDTAFGVLNGYTSSGTVQYTSITSGYRYARADGVDQTSVFTGGSTSTYRPNLSLAAQLIFVQPVELTCAASDGIYSLQWSALTNADEYQIYRSLTPDGTYSLIATTSALQYTDPESHDQAFYYIKAVKNITARLGD